MSGVLSNEQQQEIQQLRADRSIALKFLLGAGAVLALIFVIILALNSADSLKPSRDELLSTRTETAEDLIYQGDSLREWLLNHGTTLELRLFDGIASMAFASAADTLRGADFRDEHLSFFSKIYLSFHLATLRVSFLILAATRLWLVVVIGGIFWSFYSLRDHQGPDILGRTGIGRLFYSGIRGDLEQTDKRGAPVALVPGLACPPKTSLAAARASNLGEVLRKFDAYNEVNGTLAAIINAASSLPGYAPPREEALAHERFIAPSNLPSTAEEVLRQVLSLHLIYRLASSSETLLPVPRMASPDGPMSSETYAAELQRSCHRALTEAMRAEIAKIPAPLMATLVLAEEAGKVLAYAREAGKWVRRSSFPELSSRAVLHSVPSLSTVYSPESRQLIRQALIYASRKSIFAPIRFPVDLTDGARALRQWSELLMTCPHHLSKAASEVELVGIATEAHRGWQKLFIDSINTSAREVVGGTLATHSNLLFIPAKTLLSLMRRVIPRPTVVRMEELLDLVTMKHEQEGGESSADGEDPQILARDRWPTPLNASELKELAELHGLSEGEVREWSVFRIVLNCYGWLARRVGDYSVPSSSLVYGVFRTDAPGISVNERGLFSRKGLIPIRATRLQEQWGRNWYNRFLVVSDPAIALDEKDAAQKLQGVEDRAPADEEQRVVHGV